MRISAAIFSRAFIIRIFIVCGLFSQGLLLGNLSIYWVQDKQASKVEAASQASGTSPEYSTAGPSVALPLPEPVLEQKRLLGERLLINGEPYQALRNLLVVRQHQGEAADDMLQFEIAICYEAANDNSTAREIYSQICNRTLNSSNRDLVDAAQLAVARTSWKNGEKKLAMQILWKKVFSPTSRYDKLFYGDIMHMAGQVIAEYATLHDSVSLMDPSALSEFPIDFRPEREITKLLDLRSAEYPEMEDVPISPTIKVDNLLKVDLAADAIVLDLECHESSILQALQLLNETTGLEFHVTDRATTAIHGNIISLNAKGASLAMLLDKMTFPNNLWWTQQDNRIVVGLEDELETVQFHTALRQAARRLLARAALEFPEHDFLGHSNFNLAVVDARDGNSQNAVTLFLNMLEASSRTQVRQCCFYNLAKIYKSMKQYDLSMDAMQKVTESASIGQMLTAAYLEIGEMQLSNGDLDNSIHSFSRSLQVSNNKYLSQLGAINLAATYLIRGEPKLANQVMNEKSRYFELDSVGMLARYIAALASFESSNNNSMFNVNDSTASNLTAINLLAILPKVKPIKHIGPQQYLLIARGWSAIGATSEVEQLASDGLQLCVGSFIRDAISFQLVNSMIKENRLDIARGVLASLEYSQAKPESLKKLLEWATLEFEQGDVTKSKLICEELLQFELEKDVLAGTFQLLGFIHRNQGEHRIASLYFAGFRPE